MNQTILSRALFSGALFAAGCAIGYFAGVDRSTPHREAASDSGTRPSARLSASENRGQVRAGGTGAKETGRAPSLAAIASGTRDEALIGRFAECLLEPAEDERAAVWLALLKHLTPDDAPAVCALFQKLGGRFGFEWSALWRKWGQLDGAGAMDYLEHNPETGPTAELKQQVMRGWAQKNPEAARLWLANQATLGTNGNLEALTGFIDGRARSDYLDATRLALAMVKPEHENASQIASVLADQALLQAGVQGLVSWFDQIPNDEHAAFLKKLAASALIERLQDASPARAMEWISQHTEPAWRDDDAVGNTAGRAATEIDPQTALNWLTTLPPSSQSGAYPGMNRVIRQFAAKDPSALETWLREPKPQDVQDQALAAYARALQEGANPNPSAAEQWLAQIQDPRWKQSPGTVDLVFDGALQRSFRVIRGGAASSPNMSGQMTISVEPFKNH